MFLGQTPSALRVRSLTAVSCGPQDMDTRRLDGASLIILRMSQRAVGRDVFESADACEELPCPLSAEGLCAQAVLVDYDESAFSSVSRPFHEGEKVRISERQRVQRAFLVEHSPRFFQPVDRSNKIANLPRGSFPILGPRFDDVQAAAEAVFESDRHHHAR